MGGALSPPVAPGSPFDFARIPITPPRLQRELAISSPGDPFEREADAVADKVMRTPQPAPVGSGLRRGNAEAGAPLALAPPVVHEVLARPGRPLEPAARDAMEGRFGGADFSSVRVHDDARAAQSALAVGAHAYSVGSDVVFAPGRYGPGTATGDRLLAHELAHTLQGGANTLRRQPLDATLLGDDTDEPQSLKNSINGSNPLAVRAEIARIRRWLARQPPGADNATIQHLRAELARLEALAGPTLPRTTVWEAFASSFNTEFADVLNVFGVPPAPLTAARLEALFTDTQRQKLQDFILTRRIPDRLFNGSDRGATTAQQRLLLSAHILANGIYRPGSFDQRVHAQFCFHWVQIVHHYAGATPPGSGFAGGVMGSFDPLGAAVFNTGRSIDVANPKRVSRPDLPTEESPGVVEMPPSCGHGQEGAGKEGSPTPGGLGPLHEGTPQAEAAAKAEAENPGKGARYYRQPHLPFEKFSEFQTGDWLYLYNGNSSEGGGHSVIFSHWETGKDLVKTPPGARYRVAIVWSQPRPDVGGVRHKANLGDRFVPNPANNLAPFVTPVTFVSRVTPDTGPATTAAEMLPGRTGAAATKLAKDNADFIQRKKLKGPVNRKKLTTWLQTRNESFLVSLGNHLDPGQRAVLRAVNRGDDLEALVRLYQRLRTLSANARLLDANTRAYNAKLDPKHKKAQENKEAEVATATRNLRAVDVEIESVESDPRLNDPTLARELEATAAELQREISRLKDGPERDELKMRREHYLDRAAAARGVQRKRGELRVSRDKALKARDAAQAIKLPYGIVHPGDLGKEDRRQQTTGRLEDINADIEWDTLVDPAPTAPSLTTPKKP
ncbi:eCIS core domain-containing protein [Pyxidicoccus sp. MSG2]|uniref:eCIS core domain-containing protein n=1 Tax=Pyxidicoccus sp. MSG2 TaxID=2996790 RepID=UPI0022715CD1|nr:DUF4157 domain-containing protein [Pyxidicoccus sp. MSG2]MCY1020042.1 DUF4157 domain-containing protein [Pyxidicoccus sp. MSG2]